MGESLVCVLKYNTELFAQARIETMAGHLRRLVESIDPRTGKSPDSVRSVTILAEDGLTSEALSKCVFVMGVDEGLRLIESQPGVDAVVVDSAGGLHYSSGLLDGVSLG